MAAVDAVSKSTGYQFGTFEGVFTPSILTILGVVMYLRFGWVLGNVGLTLTIVIVSLAVVLLQVDSFRSVGLALLSSAGAAAVLLGVAGHAVLGNLVAGLQIALVQPFRIGDTVFVEGNWGRIEDITYVDVIVRTWDERRLIFPIGYFVSHWFENWSKTDPFLLRSIYVKVDYRANVETIRQKFVEIVREDEDWASDRDEPEVLVTECNDETMTIRLTCGGADPSRAWSLVCRVRERLMAWLQEEDGGRYLPRRRLVLDRSCGPDEEHVEGETAQL